MARFKESAIPGRYKELAAKRQGFVSRGQTYANWTLPHMFPDSAENEADTNDYGRAENDGSWTSIGARVVNHLANKYMLALFPAGKSFFRSDVPDRVFEEVKKTYGVDRAELEFIFARMEREAGIAQFERIFLRSAFLEALKLLIITGNALVYVPPGMKQRARVYSLYDYVVARDASGEVIEIITVDRKDRTTIGKGLQKELDAKLRRKGEKPDQTYKLYTRIRLTSKDGEKRYHVTQALEGFDVKGESWVKPENMRWFPLVWTRMRSENYGRGLVEEHSASFHAVDVLAMALAEGVVAASDIKYLVDPNSGVDVHALTKSESGTYHYGDKESVWQVNTSNQQVWQFLMERTQHYERELGLIFLLNTAATRDAERVTAEEIRMQAQELETSHGGVYSTLAMEFQTPLASLLLKEVDSGDIQKYGVKPIVLTGLEALGRAADLDSLVRWLETLGMLQNIPEEFRAVLKARAFAIASATGFGVEYSTFIQSEKEAAAAMQAQQQSATMNGMMQGGIDGVSQMIGKLKPEEAAQLITQLQGQTGQAQGG